MRKEEDRYFSEEIQPLLDSIEERENALEGAKKKIYRKIAGLREKIEVLENEIKHLHRELDEARQKARDRRGELVKLRKVSEALQTINEFMQNGNSGW
jgi:chromosome segregation ATPase